MQARNRSKKLQQGDISPEQAQELIGDNAAFYEAVLLGVIEGGVTNFN